MAEIKEPIRIRRKKLTNGNVSLYLDIYLNGKREYEFLKLYLIPEKTKADREANRQTLQLANSIKARRIVEVQNGEHGFKSAYAPTPSSSTTTVRCAPGGSERRVPEIGGIGNHA